MEMSDRTRAYFEADPEDKTGDARRGRAIIREMQDLVKQKARQAQGNRVKEERDNGLKC
jgi:hypothetical protein